MANQSLSSVACYNAFVGRLNLSRGQAISIAVSLALEIPLIVACNGVLIIALYKTKQLKSAANCVVMLLCISDLFVGLLSIPLMVILFAAFSHTRNCWLEMSTMFVCQFNSHFSGYMTMIMAIQRYLNANPSMLLRRRSSIIEMMTSEIGCKMMTCIAFIVSIAHGVVTTYSFNSTKSNIPNVIMVAINFIAVTTAYILYGKLLCGIRFHVANIVSHDSRPRCDLNIGNTPETTRHTRSHAQISFVVNQEKIETRQDNARIDKDNIRTRLTTVTNTTFDGPCVVSSNGLKPDATRRARCNTLPISFHTTQKTIKPKQENKCADEDNINTMPRVSNGTNLITSKKKVIPPQARYYNDFTKTIALILLSLAICTFPFLITDLWTGWYSFVERTKAPQTVRYLFFLSTAPGFLHCTINALLLLYRNRAASRYVKNALRLTKKNSSEGSREVR